MKPRTFFLLIITCAVLGLITYFVTQKDDTHNKPSSKMGKLLFEDLPVNDVTRMIIKTQSGEVDLKRSEKGWQVVNKHDYPADFDTISDFLRKLMKLKIGRSFEADDGTRKRLSLNAPTENQENSGTEVILKDGSDETLAHFILGKERHSTSGVGGVYILPVAKSEIHLVGESFWDLAAEPADWLEKELTHVAPQEVKQVIAYSASGRQLFSLTRTKKEDEPLWPGLPKGETLSSEKVDSLFGALESLTLEDVSQPLGSQKPDAPTLQYHLYNGTLITVTVPVPQDADTRLYDITFGIAQGAGTEEKPNNPEQVDDGKEKTTEIKLSPQLTKWHYQISKWQFDKFTTSPEALYEKKEKTDSET